MEDQRSYIDDARENLEAVGIEVGEPDQVIHRTDDSGHPKAVYTRRFDRMDIYNAGDGDETVIAVEHELLHRYQYQAYADTGVSSRDPAGGVDLQRPSEPKQGDTGSGPGIEPAAPQPVENTDQIIETLGEAFAIIYTAYRRDELDEETISSYLESLQGRGDYRGTKTAAMLDELWDRFTALEEAGEERMETFLTTIQDEYMG